MRKYLTIGLLLFSGFFWSVWPVQASEYGVHVLKPEEISDVAEEMRASRGETSAPLYVTLPFSLQDTHELDRWQASFHVAREENIIPLVRLVTRFNADNNAWEIPSQYDVVQLARALNSLQWPQDDRHIILFNEPNHDAEWGGATNPEEYAQIANFAAQWFNTENAQYTVLPAAADLAAPNGAETMEAFTFWKRALAAQPDLLENIDAWNSHSYPNPGFVAAPTRQGKNTLYGFEHELDFLASYSDREWPVYITETGWKETSANARRMASYYDYADENIWNNHQVVAVTPFLWQGAPGPFAAFSLQSEAQDLTAQGKALLSIVKRASDLLLTDTTAIPSRR